MDTRCPADAKSGESALPAQPETQRTVLPLSLPEALSDLAHQMFHLVGAIQEQNVVIAALIDQHSQMLEALIEQEDPDPDEYQALDMEGKPVRTS